MDSLGFLHGVSERDPSGPTGGSAAPRLLTRTLIVTFVTVVLILAAVFLVLTLDLRRRARHEVAHGLEDGGATIAVVEARRSAEFAVLGRTLAANPTFASALQKHRNEMGSFSRAEIRQSTTWIARQLQDVAEVLRADVAAVHDSRGLAVAAGGPLGPRWPDRLEALAGRASDSEAIVHLQEQPWRVARVPLLVRDTEVATLWIADRLDDRYVKSLSALTRSDIVVVSQQRVVAATLDQERMAGLLDAWPGDGAGSSGEIEIGNERYVYRRLLGGNVTGAYGLAALGASVSQSTAAAYRALSVVAAGSLLLGWLGSLVLARRLSAPIDRISHALTAAVESRSLRLQLPQDGSSRELDALAQAFNQLMASLERSERETQAAYLGAIRALAAALDARDPYTAGHSERVSTLSVQVAERMGLPAQRIEVVRLGALLHDIGKIGVDDAVLKKPDRLSAAEQAVIRTHPVLGARILEPVAFLAPHVPVVELHHERPDGRGYPHGLTGERIPVEARIVHVADAYDAMTSSRPYRPARSPDEAIAELQQFRGTQFDASAVDALVAVIVDQHPDIDSRQADRGVTRVA